MQFSTVSDSYLVSFEHGLGQAEQIYLSMWRDLFGQVLTYPQFLVLRGLQVRPDGPRNLADRIAVDRGAIAPIVKRLEQQNLVARVPDPSDKRKSCLSLTAAGLALADRANDRERQLADRFLAPLDRTERAALTASWLAIGEGGRDLEVAPGETAAPPLAHEPAFGLRLANIRFRELWRGAGIVDFSPSSYGLLTAIHTQPEGSIREAARTAGVEESTAVRAIMRLVRLRYVSEHRDVLDSRRAVLSVTPHGERGVYEVESRLQRIRTQLWAPIPSSNRALIRGLNQFLCDRTPSDMTQMS